MKYGISMVVSKSSSKSCSCSRAWFPADIYANWALDPIKARTFDSIEEARSFKRRYFLPGSVASIY